jgi:hypothetical protein
MKIERPCTNVIGPGRSDGFSIRVMPTAGEQENFMRAPIVAFALISFVAAATLPDRAQAQTPVGSFRSTAADKRVLKHKKTKKAQLQSQAPAVPATTMPTLEERPGPKMGM